MEYKLLEQAELALMQNVLDHDSMVYNIDYLDNFLKEKDSYGFIAKEEGKVIGFAYGYSLIRPDGKMMFYLHSIGILPSYQNKGYGTGLLAYIKEFSKEIGCAKMFLITDKSNLSACHVYEKLGGRNDDDDEVVYVYDHKLELS